MIKKQTIFISILIGIASLFAIIYFYMAQRKFTHEYRYFSVTLHKLDNIEDNTKSTILNNSIYTYTNQDNIAKEIKDSKKTLNQLLNSDILKRKGYNSIRTKTKKLKIDINTNNNNIEKYLMLNAGIKNSLLFLSRYIDNATKLKKQDKFLYIKANKIVQLYLNTRHMQDIDYLYKKDYLLHSNSKDKDTQDFIHYFNLHSNFLMRSYPPFIKKTQTILHNDVIQKIKIITKEFSNITINDFKEFDRFALLIFLTFIISFTLIIILFANYVKNNLRLLKLTNSLEYSLKYDRLTNLRNRYSFEKDLRFIKNPHLLLLNINAFKNINDIYGNDMGNILLIQFANYLKKIVTNTPHKKIYRLGGDDFGILFDNIQKDYALEICHSINETISTHDFIIDDNKIINMTVSISSNNTEPILENADIALKEIKKHSLQHIIEYDDELHLKSDIKNNMQMLDEIKNALKDNRIVPYFQPIVNIKTSKVEKYEALVRLIKKDGEVLSPYYFLDISKKTPYYHEITKTMIQKTVEVAKQFPQYRFSINISMMDILNDELTDMLFKVFDNNKDTVSRIDIELLESENLEDMNIVKNFIDRLHTYGSKILIDDFGSGYSNFAYFSSLDIDLVKIDGSIVSEITTNKRKLHMLKSIYNFSKGMGMLNVAEFVETKESVTLLKETGVTYIQGYYFSPPIPMPLEKSSIKL